MIARLRPKLEYSIQFAQANLILISMCKTNDASALFRRYQLFRASHAKLPNIEMSAVEPILYPIPTGCRICCNCDFS